METDQSDVNALKAQLQQMLDETRREKEAARAESAAMRAEMEVMKKEKEEEARKKEKKRRAKEEEKRREEREAKKREREEREDEEWRVREAVDKKRKEDEERRRAAVKPRSIGWKKAKPSSDEEETEFDEWQFEGRRLPPSMAKMVSASHKRKVAARDLDMLVCHTMTARKHETRLRFRGDLEVVLVFFLTVHYCFRYCYTWKFGSKTYNVNVILGIRRSIAKFQKSHLE